MLTLTSLPTGDDLKEDKFSLKTLYSRFRPSLKKVDPSTEVTQGPIPGWELLLPDPGPQHPGAVWGGWGPFSSEAERGQCSGAPWPHLLSPTPQLHIQRPRVVTTAQ